MHFMPSAICDYVFIAVTEHFDDKIVSWPPQPCWCDVKTQCLFTAATPGSTLITLRQGRKKFQHG